MMRSGFATFVCLLCLTVAAAPARSQCPEGPEVGALEVTDPVFNRPVGAGAGCSPSGTGTAVFYDVYSYDLAGPPPHDLFASLVGGTSFDSVLVFYQAPGGVQDPFDPTQPCLNNVAYNDDFGGTLQSQLSEAALEEGWVDVVVTTFGNDATGSYTLDVSSQSCQAGGPPDIDVSPPSLSSSQPPDSTIQQSLIVANIGGGALDWLINEENLPRPPRTDAVIDPASARENAGQVADPEAPPAKPEGVSIWQRPDTVLWDNGPLVNCPGCGAGGADESQVQNSSLLMTTLGFGHQVLNDNWVADDFVVSDAEGWDVTSVTFFAYQTGSNTTSTMTSVNWALYDGDPSGAGSVVANGSGLSATGWTNIYRTTETTIGDTGRPIMFDTVQFPPMNLPTGTYWLAWQTAGTLASGPWAPPVTILGQATTGNGLQSQAGMASFAPAIDTGSSTQQGFPFIVEGTIGSSLPCTNPSDIPWLSVAPTSGSTAGGGNDTVTVTFDSTGLASGTYAADLCVASNDPDPGPGNGTDLVVVPVSLTVSEGVVEISLTKTVGTDLDPGTCAPGDAIAVTAGTDVNYCYSVTNTGDVTLNFHDLDDNMLGSIFTDLNYALTPGTSVYVTQTATINTTTVNTATWTAYNLSGPQAVSSDTATVIVVDANQIFSDGFESNSTAAWSTTYP